MQQFLQISNWSDHRYESYYQKKNQNFSLFSRKTKWRIWRKYVGVSWGCDWLPVWFQNGQLVLWLAGNGWFQMFQFVPILQRWLAVLLRKDDTQIREAFHIFPYVVLKIAMIVMCWSSTGPEYCRRPPLPRPASSDDGSSNSLHSLFLSKTMKRFI